MILDLIKSINIEISEQINNEDMYFNLKYTSDAYCDYITFLGLCIWDSDNNICLYDEVTDT